MYLSGEQKGKQSMSYTICRSKGLKALIWKLCQVLILLSVLDMGFVAGKNLYAQDIVFTNLPSVQGLDYKVDPYIEVAGQLQKMGKKAATLQLLRLARAATNNEPSSFDNEQRTAILCRMLFIPRHGRIFNRPSYLGGAGFVGEQFVIEPRGYTNWLNEPIEIVDGIPFAIVYGYSYEGIWNPHAAESYLGYCLSMCDWSSVHYIQKSKAEKLQALKKLLASPKWRRPLDYDDREYLFDQID